MGWVATGTVAFPALFIVIRITHYEDKIPDMIGQVNTWLGEIEAQLQTEIETLASMVRANRNFERVLSITSNFSAVKEIQKELDKAETNNSARIDLDIATAVLIIVTGLLYYGSSFPNYDSAYNLSFLAGAGTVVSAILWASSVWAFYSTQSQYSKFKRLIRTRQLNP